LLDHAMFHPASLLLAWLVFALGLQWLKVAWLTAIAALCLLCAVLLARERSYGLLRRSRWLMLSLGGLYLFATPGEYLPGLAGALGLTYEGVRLGAEQIGRLLAMLASLALLHHWLGTAGLLAALHGLLKPFPWRERTVVRLMLALEALERQQGLSWQEWLSPAEEALPSRLTLTAPSFRPADYALLALLGGVGLLVTFLP
jgi:hypothetical protein